MLEKIILVLLFGLLGLFVGKILAKRMKLQEKYFEELARFCDVLLSDVLIEHNGVSGVISSFDYHSEEFKQDAISYSKTKNIKINKIVSRKYRYVAEDVFKAIGAFDESVQYEILKNKRDIVLQTATEYKGRVKKEYSAMIKLGFLFGICIGVLMI